MNPRCLLPGTDEATAENAAKGGMNARGLISEDTFPHGMTPDPEEGPWDCGSIESSASAEY